jgi:hypothetical protein
MIPVETILGIMEGGINYMMDGVNASVRYLIDCKNICKCHSVPHPAQQ